jgi:hypothetical protein
MSLLPPAASGLERIQDVWASISGRGVQLSQLDTEAAARWLAQAPLEVVLGALEAGRRRLQYDARPGERPRSLRACAPDVQRAIRAHRARAVGGRHG